MPLHKREQARVKGANVDNTGKSGQNALDIVIENHHQITAALLVGAGAEPVSDGSRQKLTELMRDATPLRQILNQASFRPFLTLVGREIASS